MKTERQSEDHNAKEGGDREPTITLKSKTDVRTILALMPVFIFLIGIYIKLDGIQRDIRKSWTISDQRIFAAELSRRNPNLSIPETVEIHNSTQ